MSQESLQLQRAATARLVYYEGELASHPYVMAGTLTLDSRNLIFQIYEQRYTAVLQYGQLASTGKMISISLSNIVDVSVEPWSPSRGSSSGRDGEDPFSIGVAATAGSGTTAEGGPSGYQRYQEKHVKLMITAETQAGVEVVRFDVQHPESLEPPLRDYFARNTKRT
jgi:hypothetical protein